MTKKPLTLEDLLESGTIRINDSQLSKIRKSEAATNKWAIETSTRGIGAERKEGRPPKAMKVPPTEVRSLRLEVALWGIVEQLSHEYNHSINRFIEESIINYIDALEYHWSETPGLSDSLSSWGDQLQAKEGFISLVNLDEQAA
jgi:hypothetical protein